ncbi:hypothetical protein K439DRAFT_1374101 [Ramaria rubella]|nr:hypothetical protein K439DRAFT_1374101 [Ramaria rubella]
MIAREIEEATKSKGRFEQEHFKKILEAITIGTDLSSLEKESVRALVREYADVFALSLSDVQPVDFIRHTLNLPPEIQGPQRASQKPLSAPQIEWLDKTLDNMEIAGIIKKITVTEAKWVSPSLLEPKEAGQRGLSLKEL